MQKLNVFVALWLTQTQVYLAELATKIKLERWQVFSNAEELCQFLETVNETEIIETMTIITPDAMTLTAKEFLEKHCQCSKQIKPKPLGKITSLAIDCITFMLYTMLSD